jgi:hypothetical protein
VEGFPAPLVGKSPTPGARRPLQPLSSGP